MKYKGILVNLVFIFLLVSTSLAGNFFDLKESFDNLNITLAGSTMNGAGTGCVDSNPTPNLLTRGSDLNWSTCAVNAPQAFSFLYNNSDTFDSSAQSVRMNFSSTNLQAYALDLRRFCDVGSECFVRNTTRIVFDYDCTDNSWLSTDQIIMGFYNRQSGQTAPVSFNYSFFSYIKNPVASRCKLNDFEAACINGYVRYNFTLQEALNGDSDCTLDEDKPINSFVFTLAQNNNPDFHLLDNIQLLGIFNGTNELPNFNVTFNNSVLCLNESQNFATFSFEIEADDPENDTIFYATQLDFRNFTNTVLFTGKTLQNAFKTTIWCPLASFNCAPAPSFDFLSRIVGDISDFNQDVLNYNRSQFNLIPDISSDVDSFAGFENQVGYFLEFTNQSPQQNDVNVPYVNITGFQYNFEYPILRPEVSSTIYNLDQAEIYGAYLADATNQPYIHFSFISTVGTLFVYNINITDLSTNLVSAIAVDHEFIGYTIIIDENFTTYDLRLVFPDSSSLLQDIPITNLNNQTLVNSIKIYSDPVPTFDGEMRISGLSYKGAIEDPDFSIFKPNNVTIFGLGRTIINIFVSDARHFMIPEFRSQEIAVTVVECSEFTEVSPTFKDAGSGMKLGITSICNAFNHPNFLQGFDFCNVAKFFVIAFSVLMGFLIGFIFMALFPQISVGLGFITFTLFMLVGQIFIIEIGTNLKIISALIFAVGAALILLGLKGSNIPDGSIG